MSKTGQYWLSQIDEINDQNHLQWAMRLRASLTTEQTHAVLETALLRVRATTKFGRAGEMYFTRVGLEQASGEEIARYRAERFAEFGCRYLADLGCGIGGDTIALAEVATVVGVDLDEMRLRMARANVQAYGIDYQFWPLQADLHTLPVFRQVEGVFFDPARRDEHGRRLFSVYNYEPPLTLIDRWRENIPEAAVKISPGVDYTELPSMAEAEFISVNGDVKECVLWYGGLRTSAARRATLLPHRFTISSEEQHDAIPLTEPQAFLYEPDGAIIRAHLVEQLAQRLQAKKLDDQIAYLTAAHHVENPATRCFMVDDWFPFQLKRLRQYLRTRRIGQLTIKKRGSPLEPEALRQQLHLKGENQAVLFLTHIMGEPAVVIGREIKQRGS